MKENQDSLSCFYCFAYILDSSSLQHNIKHSAKLKGQLCISISDKEIHEKCFRPIKGQISGNGSTIGKTLQTFPLRVPEKEKEVIKSCCLMTG